MPFDPTKTTYSFKKISDFDRKAPDSKGGNKWLSHNGAERTHLKTDGSQGIPYPAVRVVNKNNPHEYYLGTWGGTNVPPPPQKDVKAINNNYLYFVIGGHATNQQQVYKEQYHRVITGDDYKNF